MPNVNHYDVGDRLVLEFKFRNAAGALTDPSTVTVTLKPPTGSATVYVYDDDPELERISAGVYELELTAGTPGVWHYKGAGTGAVEQAGTRRYVVDPESV